MKEFLAYVKQIYGDKSNHTALEMMAAPRKVAHLIELLSVK